METLSEMFELEIPTVHSIISKMIINEELMVSVIAAQFNGTCLYKCSFSSESFSVLFPTGITRPAHTDGGNAPHRAHLPAEHGPAAG